MIEIKPEAKKTDGITNSFSAHERGVSELEMPNWHFKYIIYPV